MNAAGGAFADEFGTSVALSGATALVGAPYRGDGADYEQGATYVEQLYAPTLTLGVSSHSVAVHKSFTVTGTFSDCLPSVKTLAICRKLSGKLTVLKRIAVSDSGAFHWAMKASKPGEWVLVATYKAEGQTLRASPSR